MTDYLTTQQAATRLGLSQQRVRQLLQAGRLTGAARHGRDWLIPAEAIDGYKPQPAGWPKGRKRGGERGR